MAGLAAPFVIFMGGPPSGGGGFAYPFASPFGGGGSGPPTPMGGFVYPFVFPFGGGLQTGGKPWIVNLHPNSEDINVKLLRPISFSIRDTESGIDPTTIHVASGYSRVYGRGTNYFDREIPATTRAGLTDPTTTVEPLLSLLPGPAPADAVVIENLTSAEERSVYFTRVPADDLSAFRNVMISGLITPVNVTNDPLILAKGPVIGIEVGPRNSAVYVFFKMVAGTRVVLITGPLDPGGPLVPATVVIYDWSFNPRYSLIWNESRGQIQLFGNDNVLIAQVPLTSFPTFGDSHVRHGTREEYVAVYGISGITNEAVQISSISFADDVGYPVRGLIKPNAYTTTLRAADLVKTTNGVDPRKDQLSPWVDDNGVNFEPVDNLGLVRFNRDLTQFARLTVTPPKSLAFYREEPGFLLSGNEGFCVDVAFFGTSTLLDGDATGMGLAIHDGFTAFRLCCFQRDDVKYLGLLKVSGNETDLDDQFYTEYDWASPGNIRFAVDGRSQTVRIYDHKDLGTPLLSVTLNRALFPAASVYGWDYVVPFIGVGHFETVEATGSMYLQGVVFSHLTRVWESFNGKVPDDHTLPLPWANITTGTPGTPVSPVTEEFVEVTCAGSDTLVYKQTAVTDSNRGASIEVRVAVSGNDKWERTGDAIILDDGTRSFVLSFTETEEGRFACLALRGITEAYQEISGFDGDGPLLSFPIDWRDPHTYRIERKPTEGTYIFVNEELKPRIFWPDSKLSFIPDSIYTTPVVAFGHFLNKCPSTAKWYFVRTFFSTGFEVSFKKNETDSALKTDLFATESIVLVEAGDFQPPPPPVPLTVGIVSVNPGPGPGPGGEATPGYPANSTWCSDINTNPPLLTTTFSRAIIPATVTGASLHLKDPLGVIVPISGYTFAAGDTEVSFTPLSPLVADPVSYTVHVLAGVLAVDNVPVTPITWSLGVQNCAAPLNIAVLKFSGIIIPSGATPAVTYLADRGNSPTTTNANSPVNQYRMSAGTLSFGRIRTNTNDLTLPVTLDVLKNGSVVGTVQVSAGAAVSLDLVFSEAYAQDDILDVRLTSQAGPGTFLGITITFEWATAVAGASLLLFSGLYDLFAGDYGGTSFCNGGSATSGSGRYRIPDGVVSNLRVNVLTNNSTNPVTLFVTRQLGNTFTFIDSSVIVGAGATGFFTIPVIGPFVSMDGLRFRAESPALGLPLLTEYLTLSASLEFVSTNGNSLLKFVGKGFQFVATGDVHLADLQETYTVGTPVIAYRLPPKLIANYRYDVSVNYAQQQQVKINLNGVTNTIRPLKRGDSTHIDNHPFSSLLGSSDLFSIIAGTFSLFFGGSATLELIDVAADPFRVVSQTPQIATAPGNSTYFLPTIPNEIIFFVLKLSHPIKVSSVVLGSTLNVVGENVYGTWLPSYANLVSVIGDEITISIVIGTTYTFLVNYLFRFHLTAGILRNSDDAPLLQPASLTKWQG